MRIVDSAPPDDQREIRLALVLNGGVSLAIWIGGVVAEIDRARRADTAHAGADPLVDAYALLLNATGSVLRTDVVAGASAGGLNGCLLAAAIVNGGNVADVRDLWIDVGSFRSLLRSGLDAAPVSILRGDDYFLPEIEREFRRRCDWQKVGSGLRTKDAAAAAAERVRLFVTGTDLLGEPVRYLDDFGSTLSEREHRGLFVLEHDPECKRSSFEQPDVARQLARIARSTASFPAAFEASYCRVGAGDETDADLLGVASFTSSRWVIDGGVLDNAPFGAALGAIARAPATGPVRRILCYVTPYGGTEASETALRENPPSLSGVVGAALNLPRDVAMVAMLNEVEEYRRRVQRRRSTRRALALHLQSLSEDAQALLPLYCRSRALASIDDLLDDVASPPHARFLREAARSTSRPRVRSAQLLVPELTLPWVPHPDRADDPALFDPGPGEWLWGIGPIKRAAAVGLDMLARTLAITPVSGAEGQDALRARVHAARGTLSGAITWVAERREDVAADTRRRLEDGALDAEELARRLLALRGLEVNRRLAALDADGRLQLTAVLHARESFLRSARPEDCHARMLEVVGAIRDGGSAALELLQADGLAPDSRVRLREELSALLGRDDDADGDGDTLRDLVGRLRTALGLGAAPRRGLLSRLLELEVVSETLAPSGHEHDQTLELLRINAEAPSALDGRSLPQEKLTGLGLVHFAAFYKRSWRANDWLWGRLDGASRLVDILVDPHAIRLRMEGSGGIDEVLRMLLAVARGRTGDEAFLEDRFVTRYGGSSLAEGLGDELLELGTWTLENEPPTRLPRCRDAVRARLQLEIAREELPVVARAALEDVEDEHAAPDADGARWARRRAVHVDRPQDVVAALAHLRIAERETLAGEIGSDLLTRNVATTAVVGASALSAKRSGLPGAVRVVPVALRGILLGLYALTWSLTSPRRALKTLAVVALLLALAVVVWGLLVDVDPASGAGGATVSEPPAWLAALAKVIVAGGILLGVLRGGAAGIGVGVALVVAYVSVRYGDSWSGGPGDVVQRSVEDEPLVMAGIAIVAAGLLTGFVTGRGPLWRPFLSSAPAKRAAAAAGIRVALILLYALGMAVVVEAGWNLVDEPWGAWLAAVLVAALTGAIVGTMRWACRLSSPSGLQRVLVIGGEQPLAAAVRPLLGEDVAVRHRGAPHKDAKLPAEGDIPPPGELDGRNRIVLVRPRKQVDDAYRRAEADAAVRTDDWLLVVGGVRWRPGWYPSVLRRLLLGSGDDGFAVAAKLARNPPRAGGDAGTSVRT